jgi:hypothetical protein
VVPFPNYIGSLPRAAACIPRYCTPEGTTGTLTILNESMRDDSRVNIMDLSVPSEIRSSVRRPKHHRVFQLVAASLP